jgi:hypothetical protein
MIETALSYGESLVFVFQIVIELVFKIVQVPETDEVPAVYESISDGCQHRIHHDHGARRKRFEEPVVAFPVWNTVACDDDSRAPHLVEVLFLKVVSSLDTDLASEPDSC